MLNVLFLVFTNNEPISVLQSIDKKFIIYIFILLFLPISKSFGIDLNKFDPNKGVIALMYHRFNENKYPSTNIKNEIFLEHLKEINNQEIEFITYEKFEKIIEIADSDLDLIVVAVSSVGIDWVGDEISKFYKANTPIVLLT